jgi:hypothetical protein
MLFRMGAIVQAQAEHQIQSSDLLPSMPIQRIPPDPSPGSGFPGWSGNAGLQQQTSPQSAQYRRTGSGLRGLFGQFCHGLGPEEELVRAQVFHGLDIQGFL